MTDDSVLGDTSRRRLLLGVGTGVAVAAAGCTSGNPSGADRVPVRGDGDADVTLEVYEDLNCPTCRQYAQTVFPAVQTNYLTEGRIRYEHRDFVVTDPRDQTGPARRAANAAREVYDRHGNGAFWEFTASVFDNQGSLGPGAPAFLGGLADGLGFDGGAVEAAASNLEYDDAIDADMERGQALGVRGTPSFVLDGDLLSPNLGTLASDLAQELDRALSE